MEKVFWIGGGQWVGKTSVALRLARKHSLQFYPYDYHSARGQRWRVSLQPERYPHSSAFARSSGDERWTFPPPELMAETAQRIFDERFAMVLDDLEPLLVDLPFVVEGWGIRPRHVDGLVADRRRALFMVPTDEFVEVQVTRVPRAQGLTGLELSDPQRAQRNRLARDRLLRFDCIAEARRYGFPILTIDGSQDLDEVTSRVESHFGLGG